MFKDRLDYYKARAASLERALARASGARRAALGHPCSWSRLLRSRRKWRMLRRVWSIDVEVCRGQIAVMEAVRGSGYQRRIMPFECLGSDPDFKEGGKKNDSKEKDN